MAASVEHGACRDSAALWEKEENALENDRVHKIQIYPSW